ncbi:MAG: heparinase II/III family protein [Clostridia bacterium]
MLADIHKDRLSAILLPPEGFVPYPPIDDRKKWEALEEEQRSLLITGGEECLGFEWPSLSLTAYMDASIRNERNSACLRMEEKRKVLGALVVAECVQDEGRYLDAIQNGIWSICEESSWIHPANTYMQHSWPDKLCDTKDPVVDLFSGHTAGLLAWTHALLKKRLDSVSVNISKRIRTEVKTRILVPFLESDEFWWMGFRREMNPRMNMVHPINNWNPWCNLHCLICLLILEDDWRKRHAGVLKVMKSLDIYLDNLPDDGGCDEGPGYWTMATGAVLEILDLLYIATDGEIDLFAHPKIRSMASYIYKAYVGKGRFINYADARSRMEITSDIVMRYGKKLKDPMMYSMGVDLVKEGYFEKVLRTDGLTRKLAMLFGYANEEFEKTADYHPRDVWWPAIQVMAARERQGSEEGFHLSAKAGHNGESHNHNDVGQFIVHLDAVPLLLDPGVGTYVGDTFSEKRYNLWTMQSAYHNLPLLNGHMQVPGRTHKAEDVRYRADDSGAWMRMEIAGAYPEEAGIASWIRTVSLERTQNASVILREDFTFRHASPEVTLHLMAYKEPRDHKEGLILLGETACLEYERERFDVLIEAVPVDDPLLRQSWNERVYRMIFRMRNPEKRDGYTMKIFRMKAGV